MEECSEGFQSVIPHNCFVEALDFCLIAASGQVRSSVPPFVLMFVSQSGMLISRRHKYNSNEIETSKDLFRLLYYVIVIHYKNSNCVKHQSWEMLRNHDQQNINEEIGMKIEEKQKTDCICDP